MRLLKAGLATASLLLFVSPALADPDTTSTPQPDANSRVICKEVEVTGSLLPGPRICHTKAEWDDMTRKARDATNENQMRGMQGGAPGGG